MISSVGPIKAAWNTVVTYMQRLGCCCLCDGRGVDDEEELMMEAAKKALLTKQYVGGVPRVPPQGRMGDVSFCCDDNLVLAVPSATPDLWDWSEEFVSFSDDSISEQSVRIVATPHFEYFPRQ